MGNGTRFVVKGVVKTKRSEIQGALRVARRSHAVRSIAIFPLPFGELSQRAGAATAWAA